MKCYKQQQRQQQKNKTIKLIGKRISLGRQFVTKFYKWENKEKGIKKKW